MHRSTSLVWSLVCTLHALIIQYSHFYSLRSLCQLQRESGKKKMEGLNNACNIDASNQQCLFKWNWLLLVSQITHIWLAHRCRAYRKRGDGGERVPRTLSPFLHFSAGNQYCLLNYWANLIRGTAVLTALWPSNCQEAAWFPAVQILNATTIIKNRTIPLQPCQSQWAHMSTKIRLALLASSGLLLRICVLCRKICFQM